MRPILLAVALISLSVVLFGCGGSSDVSHPTGGAAILGAWQPISGTEDGSPVAMSTAMNWNPGWDRGILNFLNTGEVRLDGFRGLSHDGSVEGTWTSSPGVATVTLSGVTTAISYTITGNTLAATFTRGGHDYATTWVKVVDLTVRDSAIWDDTSTSPAVEHQWQASSITTTPAGVPPDTLQSYFGLAAGTNTVRLTLKSNGAGTIQEWNTAAPPVVVNTKSGHWFTGGGEIAFSLFSDSSVPPHTVFASETRGYYTVGAQLTTVTVDVNTGQTVTLVWDPAP